jgi:hypothetical protein
LAKPAAKRFGEHRLLLLAGIGRNLWLGLIPLATASTSGFIMITASEFLLVFFAGMSSPTFATYRMNTTDDEHTSRVVMAWSITNKTVQPVIAAGGFHAAFTSARISLIVLAVVLLPGVASPLAGRRRGSRAR